MRAIFACVVVSVISACAVLPRQEIATFTTAYGDVDKAAREVYRVYSDRRWAAGGGASDDGIDRFGITYLSILNRAVALGDREIIGILAPRMAALDSMLAFNDGLIGLAEGRRFEAVKASLAPITATLGTALGAYSTVASQGLSLLLKGLEAARSRKDLRAALGTTISITYNDSTQNKAVALNGHPADVLLQLLAADVHDFKIKVKEWASDRFTKLSEAIAENPAPALLAERAEVVDDAWAFMQALDDYAGLLAQSRVHFDMLRQAAFTDSKILRTAEFARLTLDLGTDARALIRSIR